MIDQLKAATEILLVEDEPVIAMHIESVLRESGFRVTGPFETVSNGSAAASRFTGHVALVDLLLQGDDATVVTEILAQRNIPFIVMTGRAELDRATAVPGAPVLKKPFLIEDLLQTVREIVPG